MEPGRSAWGSWAGGRRVERCVAGRLFAQPAVLAFLLGRELAAAASLYGSSAQKEEEVGGEFSLVRS